jgi:hypothetical protein
MQFGTGAFKRTRGDMPELPVVNMFAEPAPTDDVPLILQSRPGLVDGTTYGSLPIDALFKKDGVVSGRLFAVTGGALYGPGVLGSVDGTGPVSMDGYASTVFVAGGGGLWSSDGATVSAVAFPDGASVTKVLVGASRLIAIRADTQKFYWSNVLSSVISGLSFASAEGQPDRLLDALFIDDILILFGAETVEFWPNTQDANLPFQPLEGRVFERGVKATGCAAKFNSTFAWVSNTNQVCLTDPENIISDPGLEALIEASAAVSLWTFLLEGTEFLALRIDGATWVFSPRSGRWSQFVTNSEDSWRAQCFAGGVFGSADNGQTFTWGAGHVDHGGVLERRWRAGFPITAGGLNVENVIARLNVGHSPFLTGTYAAPAIEMRRSLDAGQTWGKWRRVGLGAQGKYRSRVQWTACGLAGQPGLLCEFRATDPIDVRVSDIAFNEQMGGF